MKDTIATLALSATATAGGAAASAAGDTVMQWVTLGINIAILITNCIINIRKKWHESENELKKDDEESGGNG